MPVDEGTQQWRSVRHRQYRRRRQAGNMARSQVRCLARSEAGVPRTRGTRTATGVVRGWGNPGQVGVWGAAPSGAMIVATLVLVAAGRLQRLLGEQAVRAFERLMGLVLTAVAVEMLVGGIKSIAAQVH